MKTASTALKDFLLTNSACVHADLYTFTLANGAGVLRYASTDTPVTVNGARFGLGPLCQDGGVDAQRGVHVSTVDITLYADARHTVAGKPFLDFVEDYGLDGAAVKIERAFAASFADMASAGPVGTYIRFGGKVAEAQTLGATQVVVQAASWLDLLGANLPADTYQTSCSEHAGRRPLRRGAGGLCGGGPGGGRDQRHHLRHGPDPALGLVLARQGRLHQRRQHRRHGDGEDL